ncbi:MAG: UDP-N-acetylenolpyruvoylglucosamine reductase [Spirochaetaceae bacterium]|nr:UDP-N-acetylenolpyruvoylglucosamine reductase [Spirochaetaceae bacterium]|tara:strand:+ start:67727 stop:68857 length:1131 start_codon:yes stop_codon:yes gene_type:complete
MNSAIESQRELAPLTTLRLGGDARYFLKASSVEDILHGLSFAREKKIPLYTLGGGSNTIFSDQGFPGLVMHIATRGIETIDQDERSALLDVQAGENWDEFVQHCIAHGLAGVECLSGIPGQVGAVPIQNVGAYGQEVAQTIESVRCLDRITFEQVVFTNQQCEFAYRQSRFKSYDRDRYIVLGVAFRLSTVNIQEPRYEELKRALGPVDFSHASGIPGAPDKTLARAEERAEALQRLREAVLALRKKKSMVVDRADPNSISAGSFFLNPVIPAGQIQDFRDRMERAGLTDYPCFEVPDGFKLSAAWLVENSGFQKGFTENGVGLSENHSLALVNRGGSAKALMELARKIQKRVFEFSGVWLEREPVLAGPEESVEQ